MASNPKPNRGRIRQLMGDERKRRNRIASEFDRLVKEYAQGRAGSACWADLVASGQKQIGNHRPDLKVEA